MMHLVPRRPSLIGSLACLAILCANVPPANAELVAIGTPVIGEGAPVTLDTATGLYWLNVRTTAGIAWDALQAGEGGYLAAGWRHATTAEVCALFEGALVPAFPPPEPCPIGGTGFPTVVTELSACGPPVFPSVCVAGLLGLIGKTGFDSPPADPGTCGQIAGPFGRSSAAVVLGAVPAYAVPAHCEGTSTTTDPTIGHFLVRTTPPGTQVLPMLTPVGGVALLAILAAQGFRMLSVRSPHRTLV